jgi:hypothetical protein
MSSLSLRISRIALCGCLCFAYAGVASAQAVVTGHKMTISLKTLSQMTNSSMDLKFDRVNVNTNDLFEACVGDPPTKTQGIYLFIDCSNLDNNVIAAVETQPLLELAEVGHIDFDDNANLNVKSTSNHGTTLKSASIPAEIELDCGLTAQATLHGIVDINYKALGQDICPNSAAVKAVGTGSSTLAGGDFIVDDGTSFSVKTRAGGIVTFPPSP